MTVVHISSVSALTGHVGTRRDTPTDTILTSDGVMVKCQADKGLSTRFLGAEWLKTRSRSQKRTRGHFEIFAGCGMILPTGFQSCKDGDMVCTRGPLGAFVVAIYCKLGDNKEGLLLVQQRSLFVVAEHRRKSLIIAIKGHVEPSL